MVGSDGAIGSGRAQLLPACVNIVPFTKARTFVRSLDLNSKTEWSEYCKSGKKPSDIPANPLDIYSNDGWAGFGDWLGTGRIADHLREYRSFKKARAFVRSLDLKSQIEWVRVF